MSISATKIIALISLAFLAVMNTGCLSSSALYSLWSASATAPVTFEAEGRGQAEGFWIARFDDVVAATLSAGQALSLELKEKSIQASQAGIHYADLKGKQIKLFIEIRTDTVTSMHIDIGWFGSVGLARLLVRQVVFELYEAGAFLQDWRPT